MRRQASVKGGLRLLAMMACLLGSLLGSIPTTSMAQNGPAYPAKHITLVVPSVAGGASDTLARFIADKLKARVGQPVLIDNRPGNNGLIAVEYVARAEPDGYTLFAALGQGYIPELFKDMRVDMVRDLEPISLFFESPFVLSVASDMPVRSLSEFIAHAKAHPGKLNYGSTAANGMLLTEALVRRLGLNVVGIPYKGSNQVIAAMLANEVQFAFDAPLLLKAHYGTGKLRPLAFTGTVRNAVSVDTPTFGELGVPGFEITFKQALWAPAKTPRAVIERLNREMIAIAALPETKERFEAMGGRPLSSTPDEMRQQLLRDQAFYRDAARASNYKPE